VYLLSGFIVRPVLSRLILYPGGCRPTRPMCADYCSCKCAQSSELSDRARQTRANETTTASTFTNCFECQSVGNLSRTVGLDQLVVSFGIKLSPSFIYSDLLQICRTRCRTTDLQSYVCRKSTQVVRDKSSEIEN